MQSMMAKEDRDSQHRFCAISPVRQGTPHWRYTTTIRRRDAKRKQPAVLSTTLAQQPGMTLPLSQFSECNTLYGFTKKSTLAHGEGTKTGLHAFPETMTVHGWRWWKWITTAAASSGVRRRLLVVNARARTARARLPPPPFLDVARTVIAYGERSRHLLPFASIDLPLFLVLQRFCHRAHTHTNAHTHIHTQTHARIFVRSLRKNMTLNKIALWSFIYAFLIGPDQDTLAVSGPNRFNCDDSFSHFVLNFCCCCVILPDAD